MRFPFEHGVWSPYVVVSGASPASWRLAVPQRTWTISFFPSFLTCSSTLVNV